MSCSAGRGHPAAHAVQGCPRAGPPPPHGPRRLMVPRPHAAIAPGQRPGYYLRPTIVFRANGTPCQSSGPKQSVVIGRQPEWAVHCLRRRTTIGPHPFPPRHPLRATRVPQCTSRDTIMGLTVRCCWLCFQRTGVSRETLVKKKNLFPNFEVGRGPTI